MHLNQGRFLPNGVSGYVLKPEFLRSLSSQFNPNTLTKGPWLQRKTFHIMVRLKSQRGLTNISNRKGNSLIQMSPTFRTF